MSIIAEAISSGISAGQTCCGQAVGIFGVIIVEAGLGLQFGDRERLVAEHRNGQLAALDERLGEQLVEMVPRALRRRGRSDCRNCLRR